MQLLVFIVTVYVSRIYKCCWIYSGYFGLLSSSTEDDITTRLLQIVQLNFGLGCAKNGSNIVRFMVRSLEAPSNRYSFFLSS